MVKKAKKNEHIVRHNRCGIVCLLRKRKNVTSREREEETFAGARKRRCPISMTLLDPSAPLEFLTTFIEYICGIVVESTGRKHGMYGGLSEK